MDLKKIKHDKWSIQTWLQNKYFKKSLIWNCKRVNWKITFESKDKFDWNIFEQPTTSELYVAYKNFDYIEWKNVICV